MIVQMLIQLVITFLNLLFFFMPVITTLPNIAGVDIDSALVTGMGSFYRFVGSFWMIGDLMVGLLVVMGYFLSKAILRVFLGSRTPGADA